MEEGAKELRKRLALYPSRRLAQHATHCDHRRCHLFLQDLGGSWLVPNSQNHRMVGVGRDLCGSSSPTLLPKQGHLQQAAQDLVQAGLEYLFPLLLSSSLFKRVASS